MTEATQLAGADVEPTSMRGLIPPSREGGRGGFLSDVVVELGFAGEEAVEQSVLDAREAGHTVDAALLEAGVVDESQLARAIAEHHGLAYADLDEFDVDPTAVRLISRTAASRYRAAPIALTDDGAQLLVAFTDPADTFAVNDIEVTTKSDVRPVVAAASAIEALIATIPEDAPGSLNGRPGKGLEEAAPPLAEGPLNGEVPAAPPDPSPATSTAAEPPDPAPATLTAAELSPSAELPLPEPSALPGSLVPSPPGPASPPREDPPSRLQEKLASLIEGALESVAESELAELESARAEREDLAAQLEAARGENAEHADREEALRAQLESARAETEDLAAQLEAARGERAEHAEREEALRAQLESARAQTEDLAPQLEAARGEKAEHAEREEALRAQLSAAQEAGSKLRDALSSLLTAASEVQSAADALEHELADPRSTGSH